MWRIMTHHRSTPRRGLTLLEVVVATVLLGLGVTGLMSATTLAVRNQRSADQRTAALYLAQEKLAEIETVGPHIWLLSRETEGTVEQPDTMFRWTVTIEPQTTGELFAVQVAVEFSTASRSGSVALETWLNDYAAAAMLNPAEDEPPTGTQTPPTAPPGR
jgi:prepilin-type N-terminal cleavage/methylation domain-containing protein